MLACLLYLNLNGAGISIEDEAALEEGYQESSDLDESEDEAQDDSQEKDGSTSQGSRPRLTLPDHTSESYDEDPEVSFP